MIGDHRGICRFSSLDEQRYRKVWTNLQDMAVAEIARGEFYPHLPTYTCSLLTLPQPYQRTKSHAIVVSTLQTTNLTGTEIQARFLEHVVGS